MDSQLDSCNTLSVRAFGSKAFYMEATQLPIIPVHIAKRGDLLKFPDENIIQSIQPILTVRRGRGPSYSAPLQESRFCAKRGVPGEKEPHYIVVNRTEPNTANTQATEIERSWTPRCMPLWGASAWGVSRYGIHLKRTSSAPSVCSISKTALKRHSICGLSPITRFLLACSPQQGASLPLAAASRGSGPGRHSI